MILALDTSGTFAGIAIADEMRPVLEWNWTPEGNHSVTLNRLLSEAMRVAGVTLDAFTGIVVCRGPGSFNGTRVAISLAKGLSLSTGIPMVGIPSLDALAFAGSAASDSVTAVISAGRSELFLAKFEGQRKDWHRTSDYLRLPLEQARVIARQSQLVVGPGLLELLSVDPHLPVLEPAWNLPRCLFLAELGRRYFDAGGVDQARILEPLYLRLSAAEEKRAADRGG